MSYGKAFAVVLGTFIAGLIEAGVATAHAVQTSGLLILTAVIIAAWGSFVAAVINW